jgi:hypothetical protein
MSERRCYFTEAARAAAAAKRRERIGKKAQMRESLEVFVVRTSDDANSYAWEIRQFGALTVRRSPAVFDLPSSAREDGEAALTTLGDLRPPSQPKAG